jgi:polyhydroxyalkanoate synthesis repressor PhaR
MITKYPNRRLYDTEKSRYVTLADIRDLVVRSEDFVVIDRKTDEDITRSILLQVITEQELHGDALMSEDFLSQVIRSYGKVVPGFAADYLAESMKFFMTQQQNLRSQIKRAVGLDPFAAVADVTHKNFSRWKSLQEEVLRRFATVTGLDDLHGDALPAESNEA